MSVAEMTYRQVLVVDDDAIMRELLTALLEIEGYTVHAVESGQQALDSLAAGASADVILVDLHMPGLHGTELAKRLTKVKAPDALLIAMSGSGLLPEQASLFAAFLEKPFAVEDLAATIEALRTQTPAEVLENHTAFPPETSVLDEDIFSRMATMLPAAQLKELYRITINDVLRRVELMRSSLRESDHLAIRAEAHAIKGGCGMVGASELSKLAAHVEAGAEEGSEKGNPPFADFDAACARLQVMLDARFSDNIETGLNGVP
jgi:CheY-like chemotaxis protein/HPt (histidine-containing phosphotransfer) domain-containing protein